MSGEPDRHEPDLSNQSAGEPVKANGRHPIDLRILEANERTFLAWIRTGLTLMAFGFVLARIGVRAGAVSAAPGVPRIDLTRLLAASLQPVWLGTAFVVLGMVCSAMGTVRYLHVRRNIIEHRIIVPSSAATLVLAVGVTVLGALLVAYLILH